VPTARSSGSSFLAVGELMMIWEGLKRRRGGGASSISKGNFWWNIAPALAIS
jgi:hypothetical protein